VVAAYRARYSPLMSKKSEELNRVLTPVKAASEPGVDLPGTNAHTLDELLALDLAS
jgi:hypothetical protein